MGVCVIKLYNLTDIDSWLLHEKFTVCQCHPHWIRNDLIVRSGQFFLLFIFLFIKLSVMEFGKRLWRKSNGDKRLLSTYRCRLLHGSLQDLSQHWANGALVRLEGTTSFQGKRAICSPCSFSPKTSLNRLPIESKLCKIMHALFNAGYCSISTKISQPVSFSYEVIRTQVIKYGRQGQWTQQMFYVWIS